MRLFAYGGVSYSERRRIGLWPPIAEGTLASGYDLHEEELSFGAGILEDQQPFLILRQKQKGRDHEQTGRFYAFSLLLDPGRDIWERFEWNAAGLLQSLIEHRSLIYRRLLRRPEDVPEEELCEVLGELQPQQYSAPAVEYGSLGPAWAASAFATSPTFVPAARGGSIGSLSVEVIATSLSELPPCFRLGPGWLVSASGENAEALGARLVIDLTSTNDQASADELIAAGKNVLSTWETVGLSPEFRELLDQFSNVPVFEWEKRYGYTPMAFLDRLRLLAGFVRPSQALDSLIITLEEKLLVSGPLEKELRSEARRLVASGSSGLTPFLTSWLLRDHFHRNIALDRTTIDRMDRDSVVKELSQRRMKPSSLGEKLPLSSDLRFDLWKNLLRVEQYPEAIPPLLYEAMEDLQRPGCESRSGGQFLELAKTAIEACELAAGNLLSWIPFRDHRLIAQLVRDELFDRTMKRAIDRSKGWPLEYLAFGLDPDGARLVSLNLEATDLREIIDVFIDELQHQGRLSVEARDWLDNLARSPLRKKVALDQKAKISEAVGGSWLPFRAIWMLYHREATYPITEIPPQPRKDLLDELRQMIAQSGADTFVPNLLGLVEAFGEIPELHQSMLASFEPALTWQTASAWIDGWNALGRSDIGDHEMLRLLVDGSDPPPDTFSLDQLGEDQLEALFHRLLFDYGRTHDVDYAKRLEQLLARSPATATSRAVLHRVLSDYDSQENRLTLLRRLGGQSSMFNMLYEYLSADRQETIVADLARADPSTFRNMAARFYDASLESEAPVTPFQRAIFSFLLSEGTSFKNAIGEERHGFYKASKIDQHLRKALSRSEGFPDETAAGSSIPESDSTFRRIWNMIGAGLSYVSRKSAESNETPSGHHKDG